MSTLMSQLNSQLREEDRRSVLKQEETAPFRSSTSTSSHSSPSVSASAAAPGPLSLNARPGSSNENVIRSFLFLMQMARNFEMEGNLAESIKSTESALLLRGSAPALIADTLASLFGHYSDKQMSTAKSSQLVKEFPFLQYYFEHEEDESRMDVLLFIAEQAKDYVLRCNSYAVSEFNQRRYDSAEYYLKRALFITSDMSGQQDQRTSRLFCADRGADDTAAAADSSTFSTSSRSARSSRTLEQERLRLRASTYNNLGCMEKRRRRMEASLAYLREAAEIEVNLSRSNGLRQSQQSGTGTGTLFTAMIHRANPSTYLNLCTVYNELGRHEEAVVAAEHAIAGLQRDLVEEEDEALQPHLAMMLAVGLYNLGVSLERRAKPTDGEAAQQAYLLCLQTCRQYLVDPHCPTVDAAVEALRRMRGGGSSSRSITPVKKKQEKAKLSPPPPQLQQRQDLAAAAAPLTSSSSAVYADETQLASRNTLFQPRGRTASDAGPERRSQSGLGQRPPLLPALRHPSHSHPLIQTMTDGGHHALYGEPRAQTYNAKRTSLSLPLPQGQGQRRPSSSLVAPVRPSSVRPASGAPFGSSRDGSGTSQSLLGGRALSAAGARPPRTPSASHNSGSQKALVPAKRSTLHRPKRPAAAGPVSGRQRRSYRGASLTPREREARMAEKLHRKMADGIAADEEQRLTQAAVLIQKTWRGGQARERVRQWLWAALCIQRVTRRHLARLAVQRRQQERLRAQRRQLQVAREEAAARVLQQHTRRFLRRCAIWRQYRARSMRNYYAARAIQRAYRDSRQRRADRLTALAERQRREDVAQQLLRKSAARTIQRGYRAYYERVLSTAARAEAASRVAAATTIQAHVRGHFARAWFRYHKEAQRQERLKEAATPARVTLVQCALRAIASQLRVVEQCDRFAREVNSARQYEAAVTIQLMWRRHVARVTYERKKAEHDMRQRRAARIADWYRMCKDRAAYVQVRDARRREKAASKVQRFYRQQKQIEKEKAFAAYHAKAQRDREIQEAQKRAVTTVEAFLAAVASGRLVQSVGASFWRDTRAAKLWQRVGRGYMARVDMHLLQESTARVFAAEQRRARENVAACVLQRAWRCASAKGQLEQLKRERAASVILVGQYRMYRARCELAARREAQREARRERAARCIQGAVRRRQERARQAEMQAYYETVHAKDMLRQLQTRAVLVIQAHWKGYQDRIVYRQARAAQQRRVAAASTIQRVWRTAHNRQQLRHELEMRANARSYYGRAALTMQCFWRTCVAKMRVAKLREIAAVRRAAATRVQCWWRCALARRRIATLRGFRREEEAAAAALGLLWERAATLAQRFLRCRQSQLHTQRTLRDMLFGQLTLNQKVRHVMRQKAATKIQAVYRGHYDRCWVRGLRKAEAEAVAREQARQMIEMRAAIRIQCAYRQRRARQVVGRLRDERMAEFERKQEAYLTSAVPQDIVKELFWLHNAVMERDFNAERLERHMRQQAAAVYIQKVWRQWCSVTRAQKVLQEQRAHKAALLVQHYWRRYRLAKAAEGVGRQTKAACVIQSAVRGWLVRKRWPQWRAQLEEARFRTVHAQDMTDLAATLIQSYWRRFVAQKRAAARREELRRKRSARAREEAAMVIQRAFRTHTQASIAA